MLSHLLSASTFFVPKQTLARIDFLRSGGRLADKSGTHNVKFFCRKVDKRSVGELMEGKLARYPVDERLSD